MRVVLDTGPLVALLNRRDTFHTWSVEHAGKLSPPFFTCEAVLAEAHFLLTGVRQGNARLIDLIASGHIDLGFSFARYSDRVNELMHTYADVPMSFADACLVCMAENEESTVFTLDSDFKIYRKKRNRPIDLIIP